MRQLAHDDDIAVAGPVITQSVRLKETELVELAKTKGQAHLAVIAGREGIGEAVTDVLVRRGDAEVMHNVADNQTARLSEGGFSALVKRAEGDGDLAEKVGQRPDIPPHLFRDLLVRATAVVQQRLLHAAKPETRSEIQRVLEKVSKEFDNSTPVLDYAAAQRAVLALHQTGSLGEPELVQYAKDKKFEETVASLSVLCGVPIETADRLMAGDRPDRSSSSARPPDTAGPPRGRSSCRAQAPRALRRRRWTPPLPTSRSCRLRPRNAWCDSGRCASLTARPPRFPAVTSV